MLQLSDFYSKYTTTPAIAQKRVEHGSVIPLRWKLYYPAVSNTDKHTASALEQQWPASCCMNIYTAALFVLSIRRNVYRKLPSNFPLMRCTLQGPRILNTICYIWNLSQPYNSRLSLPTSHRTSRRWPRGLPRIATNRAQFLFQVNI